VQGKILQKNNHHKAHLGVRPRAKKKLLHQAQTQLKRRNQVTGSEWEEKHKTKKTAKDALS